MYYVGDTANGAHSRSVHVASPARFQICNSTTTFTQIEEHCVKDTKEEDRKRANVRTCTRPRAHTRSPTRTHACEPCTRSRTRPLTQPRARTPRLHSIQMLHLRHDSPLKASVCSVLRQEAPLAMSVCSVLRHESPLEVSMSVRSLLMR